MFFFGGTHDGGVTEYLLSSLRTSVFMSEPHEGGIAKFLYWLLQGKNSV
jgi:hypothetical protein